MDFDTRRIDAMIVNKVARLTISRPPMPLIPAPNSDWAFRKVRVPLETRLDSRRFSRSSNHCTMNMATTGTNPPPTYENSLMKDELGWAPARAFMSTNYCVLGTSHLEPMNGSGLTTLVVRRGEPE